MDQGSFEAIRNNGDLASFTDQIADYFATARKAGVSEREKVIIRELGEDVSRQTEITPRRIVQYENGIKVMEEGDSIEDPGVYAEVISGYLRRIFISNRDTTEREKRIEIKYQEEKSYSLIRELQR